MYVFFFCFFLVFLVSVVLCACDVRIMRVRSANPDSKQVRRPSSVFVSSSSRSRSTSSSSAELSARTYISISLCVACSLCFWHCGCALCGGALITSICPVCPWATSPPTAPPKGQGPSDRLARRVCKLHAPAYPQILLN